METIEREKRQMVVAFVCLFFSGVGFGMFINASGLLPEILCFVWGIAFYLIFFFSLWKVKRGIVETQTEEEK